VTAAAQGEDFRLNGEKRFVLGGAAASWFIVTAALQGETQVFLVSANDTGVDARAYQMADGSLGTVLTLRDTAAALLPGGIDRVRAVAGDAMIMAAAEMTGIARRLFDDTLAYVKTREQFGQPIGRFQVIQHRMVDAYADCEAMLSALYRVLLIPAGDRFAQAAGLKAQVGDLATGVAQAAVQLHGGMGMTDELAIGHGLKRILLLSRLFGDAASGYAAVARGP
jgi:alkylation response protein AidB-like acyl-CoA dehydrogenase